MNELQEVDMEKKKRAWIYSRISDSRHLELLDYQEILLSDLAKKLDLEIAGCTREIRCGAEIYHSKIGNIIFNIKNESIDYILTFDNDRICTKRERLSEFKILCAMHHVRIVCYDAWFPFS